MLLLKTDFFIKLVLVELILYVQVWFKNKFMKLILVELVLAIQVWFEKIYTFQQVRRNFRSISIIWIWLFLAYYIIHCIICFFLYSYSLFLISLVSFSLYILSFCIIIYCSCQSLKTQKNYKTKIFLYSIMCFICIVWIVKIWYFIDFDLVW